MHAYTKCLALFKKAHISSHSGGIGSGAECGHEALGPAGTKTQRLMMDLLGRRNSENRWSFPSCPASSLLSSFSVSREASLWFLLCPSLQRSQNIQEPIYCFEAVVCILASKWYQCPRKEPAISRDTQVIVFR